MDFTVVERRQGSEVTFTACVGEPPTPVGWAVVIEQSDGSFVVPGLRVRDDYQGHGIGKALIERVQHHCQTDLALDWSAPDGSLVVGAGERRIHTTRILSEQSRSWLDTNIPKIKEP